MTFPSLEPSSVLLSSCKEVWSSEFRSEIPTGRVGWQLHRFNPAKSRAVRGTLDLSATFEAEILSVGVFQLLPRVYGEYLQV